MSQQIKATRKLTAQDAFKGILKAATTGEGDTFNLNTTKMIINRHQKVRGLTPDTFTQ